tara:strand:- start:1151 stop:1405 length:255 start_codon:yes stop_codon:yes gene_type:complete
MDIPVFAGVIISTIVILHLIIQRNNLISGLKKSNARLNKEIVSLVSLVDELKDTSSELNKMTNRSKLLQVQIDMLIANATKRHD